MEYNGTDSTFLDISKGGHSFLKEGAMAEEEEQISYRQKDGKDDTKGTQIHIGEAVF